MLDDAADANEHPAAVLGREALIVELRDEEREVGLGGRKERVEVARENGGIRLRERVGMRRRKRRGWTAVMKVSFARSSRSFLIPLILVSAPVCTPDSACPPSPASCRPPAALPSPSIATTRQRLRLPSRTINRRTLSVFDSIIRRTHSHVDAVVPASERLRLVPPPLDDKTTVTARQAADEARRSAGGGIHTRYGVELVAQRPMPRSEAGGLMRTTEGRATAQRTLGLAGARRSACE